MTRDSLSSHNPHLLEQCFLTLASSYFHWDATHISANLLGQRVRFLERLLYFKRANQAMVLSEVRWPNGFPEKSFTISFGPKR